MASSASACARSNNASARALSLRLPSFFFFRSGNLLPRQTEAVLCLWLVGGTDLFGSAYGRFGVGERLRGHGCTRCECYGHLEVSTSYENHEHATLARHSCLNVRRCTKRRRLRTVDRVKSPRGRSRFGRNKSLRYPANARTARHRPATRR